MDFDGDYKPLPPPAQRLPIGSTLRFAVGEPSGMRSSTWSVKGGKREKDTYIGSRQAMDNHKLSLHQSGIWRLAEVEERDDGRNRLIKRYDPSREVAQGWRFAAQILVPTTSLRPPFQEKSASDKRPISWWPPPRPGWALSFAIFVGDETRDPNFAVNLVGVVGSIELPSGAVIWILVEELNFAEHEPQIEGIREAMKKNRTRGTIYPAGEAWGTEVETGRPVVYDLGDLN
jgi:hypothetical protein